MAVTPLRNIGSIESTAAIVSLSSGGDGAYMDYDAATTSARFGAKGGAGTNRGVAIRTLLAGVAQAALTFAANAAASFANAVTVAAGGLVIAAGGLSITAGLLSAQAISAASGITIATGGLTISAGTLSAQSITAATGLTVIAGGITVTAGTLAAQNITAASGVTIATLGLTVTAGGITIASGALNARSITAATGLTVTTGGITIAAGTLAAQAITAASLTAASGITVTSGTLAAQALTATTGAFSSSVTIASGLTIASGGLSITAGQLVSNDIIRNNAAPNGFALGSVAGIQRIEWESANSTFSLVDAVNAQTSLKALNVTALGKLVLSATTGLILDATAATTSHKYMSLQNNTGRAIFGIDAATAFLIVGGVGNDAVVRGDTGLAFSANGGLNTHMRISSAGHVNLPTLPTSSSGLSSGDLWRNGTVVNVV
jgi:hypothetical protein